MTTATPDAAHAPDPAPTDDLSHVAARVDAGPAFARHETFAPRAGWLKKGFDAAREDRTVFLGDDAALRLGVGQNMARAIRYWCHAFRLLEEVPVRNQRAYASRPTALGTALLGDGGWDPFLEDVGSLWHLHWQLVRGAGLATAWWYAFTAWPPRDFSAGQLEADLQALVQRAYPTARAAASSLRKDVACVLHMYAARAGAGPVTEESIACPFAELGLIQPGAEPRTFAFDVGPKPDLPPALVVAACLQFAAAVVPGARTVALGRLLYDAGGPGMAYKLTAGALAEAGERGADEVRAVSLADTAGVVQLAFRGEPERLARALLERHYAAAAAPPEARA